MADLLLRDTDADELVQRIADQVIRSIGSHELIDRVGGSIADQITPIVATRRQRRLLDRAEMAEVLGISPTTFDRLRSSGQVPTKWIESMPRFDPEAVIAALPDVSRSVAARSAAPIT